MDPNGGQLDMRISLALGAWLDHEPVWLPPLEADAVLAALRDELPWEQREIVLFGRRILQPRLIAWAGDVGYRYWARRSSRGRLPPQRLGSSCAPASGLECASTTSSRTATGAAMTAWGFMRMTSPSLVRIQWSRLCRSVRRAGSSFGLAERIVGAAKESVGHRKFRVDLDGPLRQRDCFRMFRPAKVSRHRRPVGPPGLG